MYKTNESDAISSSTREEDSLEVGPHDEVNHNVTFVTANYESVVAKVTLRVGVFAVVAHGTGTYADGDAHEIAETRATARALELIGLFRPAGGQPPDETNAGAMNPATVPAAAPDPSRNPHGEDTVLNVSPYAVGWQIRSAVGAEPADTDTTSTEEDDRDDHLGSWQALEIADFSYEDDTRFVDAEKREQMIAALHQRQLSVIALLERLYEIEMVAYRCGHLSAKPERRTSLLQIQEGLLRQIRDYIMCRDRGEHIAAA